MFKRDAGNHLSATLIRRHLLQETFPSVEHADACRPVYFVTAEGEEVTIKVLNVYLEMGDALRTINQHIGPMRMRRGRHLFTGFTVPSTLLTWATQTRRVRSLKRRS